MENTDNIKDMITLIEKNNERYHRALNNLADTFDKSLSNHLRRAIALELARSESATGNKQRTGLKLSRLFFSKG